MRIRYTIRTLLFATSLIAGIGAWIAIERSRARGFEVLVRELERKAHINRPVNSDHPWANFDRRLRIGWVHDVLGDNSFELADSFIARPSSERIGKINDDDLARIGKLRHLTTLSFGSNSASTTGWHSLAALTEPESVQIFDIGVDDALAPVLERWRCLRYARLISTDISDETLRALADLPRLESLDVSGTRITDRGMEYIANCNSLASLMLGGTLVTDAGAVHLKGLRDLKYLELPDAVSREMVDQLQNQIPQCTIVD